MHAVHYYKMRLKSHCSKILFSCSNLTLLNIDALKRYWKLILMFLFETSRHLQTQLESHSASSSAKCLDVFFFFLFRWLWNSKNTEKDKKSVKFQLVRELKGCERAAPYLSSGVCVCVCVSVRESEREVRFILSTCLHPAVGRQLTTGVA